MTSVPIDIKPIEQSSARVQPKINPDASANHAANTPRNTEPYYTYSGEGSSAASTPSVTSYNPPRYGNSSTSAPKATSKLGAVAQVAAGGVIALVGVPMLILPGPGLLAIGGGVALAANGVKKILKK